MSVPASVVDELLPGPVTLVFKRTAELNPHLNPNTDLVGVRIPKHDFMRRLARACASPLVLTSANVSGSQSTLSVQVKLKVETSPIVCIITFGEVICVSVARNLSHCGLGLVQWSMVAFLATQTRLVLVLQLLISPSPAVSQ